MGLSSHRLQAAGGCWLTAWLAKGIFTAELNEKNREPSEPTGYNHSIVSDPARRCHRIFKAQDIADRFPAG